MIFIIVVIKHIQHTYLRLRLGKGVSSIASCSAVKSLLRLQLPLTGLSVWDDCIRRGAEFCMHC